MPGDMVGEVGSVNRSEGFCVEQKQVALCHHKRLQLLSGSSWLSSVNFICLMCRPDKVGVEIKRWPAPSVRQRRWWQGHHHPHQSLQAEGGNASQSFDKIFLLRIMPFTSFFQLRTECVFSSWAKQLNSVDEDIGKGLPVMVFHIVNQVFCRVTDILLHKSLPWHWMILFPENLGRNI